MKLLSNTIAAMMLFAVSLSAQALELGPTVKWCSVSADGVHESILFGYSFATGNLDCAYSNGTRSSEPVAVRVYSAGLQIGSCDMGLYAKVGGGDLGLNVSKKDILQAFSGIEVANPVKTVLTGKLKTLSVNGVVDINNVGPAVMLAEATYGKGCAIIAKINLGTLRTGEAYGEAIFKHERMLENRKKRKERENNFRNSK